MLSLVILIGFILIQRLGANSEKFSSVAPPLKRNFIATIQGMHLRCSENHVVASFS